MNKDLVKSLGSGAAKTALLGGTALAVVLSGPAGAYAEDRNRESRLEERVNDLERELRLLRNQQRRAAAAENPQRMVRSDNDRVSVEVSGRVNRAFIAAFGTGPSNQVDLLSVDNDNSSSRLRVDGTGRINPDLSVRATIEFEVQSNASDNVSTGTDGTFDTPSGVNLRKAELRFQSNTWGAVYLGQGDSATDDIAESDLSGTSVIANSDVKDTFGGIEHEDALTGTAFANTRRGDDVFNNLDGNSRQNRIRYDTPVVGGFQGRFSFDEDNSPAAAIFFGAEPMFGAQEFEIAASFGWTHRPTGQGIGGGFAPRAAGDNNLFAGSVSVLHRNSGFSVTFAGGTVRDLDGGVADTEDPWYVYVKIGYRREWFDIGETRLSVDWIRQDHTGNAGNHAQSVRFAVVQKIDSTGMELYFAYGYQTAYRRGFDLQPFHAVVTGARLKF